MAEDLPYQQATLVAQLLAERSTADAYGQASRLEAVDKQLKELGWVDPAKAAEARAAAAAEEEAGGGTSEARAKPPSGRTARPRART